MGRLDAQGKVVETCSHGAKVLSLGEPCAVVTESGEEVVTEGF